MNIPSVQFLNNQTHITQCQLASLLSWGFLPHTWQKWSPPSSHRPHRGFSVRTLTSNMTIVFFKDLFPYSQVREAWSKWPARSFWCRDVIAIKGYACEVVQQLRGQRQQDKLTSLHPFSSLLYLDSEYWKPNTPVRQEMDMRTPLQHSHPSELCSRLMGLSRQAHCVA